jgi:hypothetical protein
VSTLFETAFLGAASGRLADAARLLAERVLARPDTLVGLALGLLIGFGAVFLAVAIGLLVGSRNNSTLVAASQLSVAAITPPKISIAGIVPLRMMTNANHQRISPMKPRTAMMAPINTPAYLLITNLLY